MLSRPADTQPVPAATLSTAITAARRDFRVRPLRPRADRAPEVRRRHPGPPGRCRVRGAGQGPSGLLANAFLLAAPTSRCRVTTTRCPRRPRPAHCRPPRPASDPLAVADARRAVATPPCSARPAPPRPSTYSSTPCRDVEPENMERRQARDRPATCWPVRPAPPPHGPGRRRAEPGSAWPKPPPPAGELGRATSSRQPAFGPSSAQALPGRHGQGAQRQRPPPWTQHEQSHHGEIPTPGRQSRCSGRRLARAWRQWGKTGGMLPVPAGRPASRAPRGKPPPARPQDNRRPTQGRYPQHPAGAARLLAGQGEVARPLEGGTTTPTARGCPFPCPLERPADEPSA